MKLTNAFKIPVKTTRSVETLRGVMNANAQMATILKMNLVKTLMNVYHHRVGAMNTVWIRWVVLNASVKMAAGSVN